jgi:hypothetical protein
VPENRHRASDPPRAIFARFLKLGALACGGPAAQMSAVVLGTTAIARQ